jgi:cell division inhibitor SepF
MGALRKAGVWLGLVEEVDDRDGSYDEYGDEFGEEEFTPPARPRSIGRPSGSVHAPARDPLAERDRRSDRDARMERELRNAGRESRVEREPRPDKTPDKSGGPGRGTVRPLARPSTSATTFATQDNLALAPQVQLRERAVVADDRSPRYQITTFHPTTYKEARAIGEHYRDGVPVIMNLTAMDEPDAKRLVDFAAGLAFGLRGTIERVTNRVFLLSPANIQVTAEDKARIAEGGAVFDQG